MSNIVTDEQLSETEVDEEVISEESAYAVFFELENIAVHGRRATYEALASILNDQKIKLEPLHFGRYCLQPSPETFVPDLLEALGAKKLSASKLAEDVNSGIAMFLQSKEAKLDQGFDKFLKAAENRKMLIGAVTAVPENTASVLMQRLGLEDREVELHTYAASDNTFPRADTWLKILKTCSKSPRNCLAFVSSMASCKSALSAGMRCVAVPDEFTNYQDFGGAHTVIDSYDELDADELLETIFPTEG